MNEEFRKDRSKKGKQLSEMLVRSKGIIESTSEANIERGQELCKLLIEGKRKPIHGEKLEFILTDQKVHRER